MPLKNIYHFKVFFVVDYINTRLAIKESLCPNSLLRISLNILFSLRTSLSPLRKKVASLFTTPLWLQRSADTLQYF